MSNERKQPDNLVRRERPEDLPAIRSVNEAAFGRPDEADLVDTLRAAGPILLSLVKEVEGEIVGHILFSRMKIETASGSIPAVSLAPVAVKPQYQRRGIGEHLIRDGIDLLRERGEQIVIVLGHPKYYTKFGFSIAKARTLKSPFPPEAYMAIELTAGSLEGVSGKVKYPEAFGITE
jgi:putative acetyltransferase